VSFAKETYNVIDPTNCSHPIVSNRMSAYLYQSIFVSIGLFVYQLVSLTYLADLSAERIGLVGSRLILTVHIGLIGYICTSLTSKRKKVSFVMYIGLFCHIRWSLLSYI